MPSPYGMMTMSSVMTTMCRRRRRRPRSDRSSLLFILSTHRPMNHCYSSSCCSCHCNYAEANRFVITQRMSANDDVPIKRTLEVMERRKMTQFRNIHNTSKIDDKSTAFDDKADTTTIISETINQDTHDKNNANDSSNCDNKNDYLTNDGVIEGVWIFARHGDRTPSRPLSPIHRREDEVEFWITTLPKPSTVHAYEAYCHYYPLLVHHHNTVDDTVPPYSSFSDPAYQQRLGKDIHFGRFIDASRYPFGFLTDVGLLHLCETGRRFYNRYHHHGYHHPNITNDTDDKKHDRDEFLSVWNVQVYSTNYLRTVMSVQSFLDGMLNTNCYETLCSKITNDAATTTTETIHSPNTSNKNQIDEKFGDNHTTLEQHQNHRRIPDHSWPIKAILATNCGKNNSHNQSVHSNIDGRTIIPIQVRHSSHDPLNAFDRDSALIAELVSEVMLSPTFMQRDGNAAPIAARLANILPGLVRHHNKRKSSSSSNVKEGPQKDAIITKTSDFSLKTPSGINWVEAADHFVCRTAHNVPLAKFSDFENDYIDGVVSAEQTLQALSYQTVTHLSWRFRQWYQHPKLLATIAAPPLREVINQMKNVTNLTMNDRRPLVIYSCHDVTILGLLYAIGADFLADDDGSEWRYWPPYGSNLVFELVRIPNPKETSSSHQQQQQRHVVRILLNGKPIITVDMNKTNTEKIPHYTGTGPQRMLNINDFESILSKLEKDGGC